MFHAEALGAMEKSSTSMGSKQVAVISILSIWMFLSMFIFHGLQQLCGTRECWDGLFYRCYELITTVESVQAISSSVLGYLTNIVFNYIHVIQQFLR